MRGFKTGVGHFDFELKDDGNVVFTAPATPPHLTVVPEAGKQRFELPLIAFLNFAAAFVREEELSKLKGMTTDELMRMRFSRPDVTKACLRVLEAVESLKHMHRTAQNLHPVLEERLRELRNRLERIMIDLDKLAEIAL